MRYTFANNQTAAERLQKVSEIFNPYSTAFIRKYANKPLISAVDLGCGPGYTTQMLNMASNSKETYGFDNSDEFFYRVLLKNSAIVYLLSRILPKRPFSLSRI